MRLMIDIPDEFVDHFNRDRFEDSLMRIKTDVDNTIDKLNGHVSGRYEKETVDMLIETFKNAMVIDDAYEHTKTDKGCFCYVIKEF